MWSEVVRKLWAFAVVVLIVLMAAVACNRGEGEDGDSDDQDTERSAKKSEDGEEEDSEEEAVPVEVAVLDRGPIESVLRFSTNLEAENEVQVFSQAQRQIRALLVEEGDEVRRGQVLVRLQDEEQRTAIARVESQLAKAKREYGRQQNLFDQQLISEQVFNDATYDLEQLELALNDAKRELSYTEVQAPIGGTITERLVNLGDQVVLNQHLFDIVDFDSIVARVYVPEKELARVRAGLEARVMSEAAAGQARIGQVDRIAPRVDPRSGTVKVTIAIPRSQELLPGMYVSVELITDVRDDALLVPKRALVYDADQIFLFRVKKNATAETRVERLLIRPVLEDSDNIEVAEVVLAGDQIVIAGQAGLRDGSLVRLVGEAQGAAPATGSASAAGD